MGKKIVVIIALVLYLVLVVVAALLLKLSGGTMVLFIALLAVVGIVAAGLALWFLSKDPSFSAASDPAVASERNALLALLTEADRRLAQSPKAGVKQLSALTLLYVLGESNSAKTTVILNSGLDSDILSGEVYREKVVAATQLVNVWYAGPAAVIEVGAPAWKQRGLWQTILRHTLPGRLRASVSSRLPARAAVVCVNCERFLAGANPDELQASARLLNERLREMSETMGISLPVYVLFTKLDRVPRFAEYVKNLNTPESTQLLGAPLPFLATSAGLYAERASQAIAQNFDQLTYALSEFRYDLLSREQEAAQRAAIYEFTRELRKLKQQIVSFLVDVARPSQLSASPFLRGFFFTGVRAHVVQESYSAPAPQQPSSAPFSAGATQIFAARAAAQQSAPQQASVSSRKVAQWAFLAHLFPNLILKDRSALEASTSSKQVSLLRRLALGTVCFLLFACIVLLVVSYANNQSLASAIKKAQQNLPALSTPTTELAAGTDLLQLDALRATLVKLQGYQHDGPPLTYRMGLYEGDDLLTAGLQTYFQHFRQLILAQTQSRILTTLAQVPDTPAPGADYQATYDPLRAYLTTTSNHDKSTPDFLSPVLQQYYVNQRPLSPENQVVLRRQLDFYALCLKDKNPYTIAPDMGTVSHARLYLSKFGGIERIYQSMLAAASKSTPAVDFNHNFPGSSETVLAPHIVPAAFTKPGFTFMQDAILHPDRYFAGEVWVLGPQSGQSLDQANLTANLTNRYTADYLDQWRTFLKTAAIVHYRNLPDAAAKLNLIEGATSPLLALFWTVSRNTAVSWPAIADAFQPAQALVPPSATNQYIGPGNTTYINALLALQGSIAQVAQNPTGATDPATAGPIISAATSAHTAAQQTAQAFHIDQTAHVEGIVLKLMQDPIASTEALVRGMAPAQANGGGKSFCSGFNQMTGEFPFNPASSTPAPPDEVKALLFPTTGSLWTFYDASLKTLIVPQGLQYGPAPSAPVQVNPRFLNFFNHASGLSRALFPANAQAPTFTFTIRELPSPGITGATIAVDSQQLANPNDTKTFTWTVGSSQSASLNASYGGAKNLPLLQFSGPWAIFQLINKAHSTWTPTSGHLEFPLEVSGTPIHMPDGTPLVVKFDITMSPPIVFDQTYLAGLHCVADVASSK